MHLLLSRYLSHRPPLSTLRYHVACQRSKSRVRTSHGRTRPDHFRKMCSGSEAGSYLRLIDFVYHSTLGLRAIKKKKSRVRTSHGRTRPDPDASAAERAGGTSIRTPATASSLYSIRFNLIHSIRFNLIRADEHQNPWRGGAHHACGV